MQLSSLHALGGAGEAECITMRFNRRTFVLGAGAGAGLAALGLSGCDAAPGGGAPAGKTHARVDTLVLGAGIAGLNAALMLEEQGQRVALVEARDRVGGRVLTLLDQPGYPEMGFNSMAQGYGRGINIAKLAGVELEEVGQRYRLNGAPELFLNGQHMTREQWAAFPGNPFPDDLRMVMPGELAFKLIAEKNRLKDWTDWTNPANAALDVSVYEYFRSLGLSDAAIQLCYDVSPYYGTTSHDVSALMLEFNDGFVKAQTTTSPDSLAVKGGNQLMTDALAARVRGDIHLGHQIIAIESDDTGASVVCDNGARLTADRVICTLPFSTLRHVHFMPGLSGVQAKAVATLRYQPLSIAFVTATQPFWEEDGLGPGMWTNSRAGSVIPQRFGATPEEITGFMVQARGTLAHYWDRLGAEQALAMIIAEIETNRPAAKGKIEARAFHSWGNEPFSQGDWAYYGPGEVTGTVSQMALPAGRVHFAGEHCALGARGLEGALESSERAVMEVLTA
jgi:monoamine oxidase